MTTDPTPDQIAAAAAAIRQTWTEAERRRRSDGRTCPRQGSPPPAVEIRQYHVTTGRDGVIVSTCWRFSGLLCGRLTRRWGRGGMIGPSSHQALKTQISRSGLALSQLGQMSGKPPKGQNDPPFQSPPPIPAIPTAHAATQQGRFSSGGDSG